jgi:U3 small nucleolar RNA-associated protein 10
MVCSVQGLSPNSLICCFSTGLGPRIIPFFRDIVQLVIVVLQDSISAKQSGITGEANIVLGQSPSLVGDALDVLRAIFDSIPTFWGSSELGSVFRLYLDALAMGPARDISSFVRRVASKAPTSVLLSTYFETWPSISSAEAEVCRAWNCRASFC